MRLRSRRASVDRHYGAPELVERILDRLTAAGELAIRVGMAGQAAFTCADATALPSAGSWADVVWSQNTIMNIGDKGRLFAEVRRVLRPGGRFAFEAVLEGPVTPMHYPILGAGPLAELPDDAR